MNSPQPAGTASLPPLCEFNEPSECSTLSKSSEWSEIIDVRSPAEFAEDHLPGAVNHPVLDDEERARVGTLYKQESPFAARKIGAALVARNIARHLEEHFADRPREWRPLVYCWRGGQRSGAFTHILRQIGWDACRLNGGYKAWRRQVLEQLDHLPKQFSWQVLSGSTGSGKSRLLETLAAQGAQTLHLEHLAHHKGSVLGKPLDTPQPAQKMFETRLVIALSRFDPSRPVFVESESRRIGRLHLPDPLLDAIRNAPGLRIEARREARVEYLMRDYAHFIEQPDRLIERLEHLRGLQANAVLEHWAMLIHQGRFPELVAELLEQHYDPLYQRSQQKNRVAKDNSPLYRIDDLTDPTLESLARTILGEMESKANQAKTISRPES